MTKFVRLFIGCSVFLLIGVMVLIDEPYVLDLRTKEAGALISERPEFSRYAKLTGVRKVYRCGGASMARCSYAEFTFEQKGNAVSIEAQARFGWCDWRWRLSSFSYRTGAEFVDIQVGGGC